MLVHYIDELRDLQSTLKQNPSTEDTDVSTQIEHIQIMRDFMEPKIQRQIVPAQKRLMKEQATVKFDDIWYLLRPGKLSYYTRDGIQIGAVIESVTLKEKSDAKPARWKVMVWAVDNSWYDTRMGCATMKVKISSFEGEKLVTNLPVFPREYYDRLDGGQRRTSFERRGEKVCDILWKGHAHLEYNGHFMDEKKVPVRRMIFSTSSLCSDPESVQRTNNYRQRESSGN